MDRFSPQRWSHIIPVAFIMYMLAYVDRINVGVLVTDPTFTNALHLTASGKGDIAGIFFWGYLILQIPGGILATRWSARKFVFCLMILWGIFATLGGFVHTETQMLWDRFFLGVAEGGVWTSVLVLLARWFTLKERARANAFWMCNLPVSAIVMAPVSGILLHYFKWDTVFIIEGIPPFIWAFVWLFTVKDRPHEASWMPKEEQVELIKRLESEQRGTVKSAGYLQTFFKVDTLKLVVTYFAWMTGFYGFSLWVPSVVKTFTKDPVQIGILSAVPFIFALIGMVVNSRWSDKRGKRVSHVAIPFAIAALSMVIGQHVGSPVIKMVFLCITAIGAYSAYGPFWAIPTGLLSAEFAGAAMGLINAIGNLGGYFGPKIVGVLKDSTGSFTAGFYFLAGMLIIGALLSLTLLKQERKQASPPKSVAAQ